MNILILKYYQNSKEVVGTTKEREEKGIYDPKYDNNFKFIFGPNNQHIMKRLLTDYLPFSINEDQKIVYHQLTLTDNEYTDNEKRPIVDINIEIGTEELLEKVEQERQNSLLYFHKKNNKRKKDNEKNEKEKEKEKEKGNEKEEEKEEEKLKRVIVEMQVYNDNNFLRRIILNSMKSYSSYFKSDSKNEDIVDIYSLNFLYGKLFKRKKRKNKSSNNENNEI